MTIRLKRAYDPPDPEDGFRILVDRLWPRGVARDAARIDLWLKDIAPSKELRKWFGHDPAKWLGFKQRYFAELDGNPQAVEELRLRVRHGKVTFVYAARDHEHNDAVALLEYIRQDRTRA